MPGNYWIVARHRNHLDVMSANTIYLDSLTTATYSFTQSGAFDNGTKLLANGNHVLYGGDVNQDDVIYSPDRSEMWNNRNQAGYLITDPTLDRTCSSGDRSQAWNNRNKDTKVS